MLKAELPIYLVAISLIALMVNLSRPAGAHAGARPARHFHKLESYGVEDDLGQCSSLLEGSRASLQELARLERRYPRLFFYRVKWTFRIANGRLSAVTSYYDKSHGNISREGEQSIFLARYPGSHRQSATGIDFGMDEVKTKDLRLVVRQGGSFSDLDRIVDRRRGISIQPR